MKIKNIIAILLVSFILVSCTQAATLILPTETAIPTSTFTPVPSTATITPTPASEKLADAKDLSKWVGDYVHAYGDKVTFNGVEMDASQLTDEIRKNSDEFVITKLVNRTEILFFIVNNVPLAMKTENREWNVVTLKALADLHGMKIGTEITGSENKLIYAANYSITTPGPTIITDDGSKNNTDYYKNLVSPYIANGLDIYAPHLYWHAFFTGDYPDLDYLNNADSKTVETWMRKRANSLFEIAPEITFINVANEPVYEYQGVLGWEKSPMYNAFGKDWLKKAWHIAHEEAQNAGLDPNQISFVFNDYNNEWHNLKSDFYRKFAVEFQNELKAENITLDHPIIIGMQFHIRTGPQDNTMWYGPDSSTITYEGLLAHFNNIGEVAPINITELSARQPGSTKEGGALISAQEEAALFCTVIRAAIDSKKVKSIIFWDESNQPTLLNLSSGEKYLPYYEISRVFYEGLK